MFERNSFQSLRVVTEKDLSFMRKEKEKKQNNKEEDYKQRGFIYAMKNFYMKRGGF